VGLWNRLGLNGREPTTRVSMRVSVDEYIAGEAYDIPVALADRFIVRGYADGALSRAFSDDEVAALRSNVQVVTV
jgi:hypothetical protein